MQFCSHEIFEKVSKIVTQNNDLFSVYRKRNFRRNSGSWHSVFRREIFFAFPHKKGFNFLSPLLKKIEKKIFFFLAIFAVAWTWVVY